MRTPADGALRALMPPHQTLRDWLFGRGDHRMESCGSLGTFAAGELGVGRIVKRK